MTQEQFIEEVLEKFLPDECEMAGPTNVAAIAQGTVEFVPTKYGSNLNLSLILSMLAAAAGSINSIVSICNGIRQRSNRGPSQAEVKAFLESRPAEISAELFEAIYEHVRERLERETLVVPVTSPSLPENKATAEPEIELD